MVKWFNFWMCVWRKQEHHPRGCLHPHLQWYWLNIKAFMRASWVVPVVKNQPADAGDSRDTGFIPGLGISLGEGNGNPLQCSCLGNPMDRGVWWASRWGYKGSNMAEWLTLSLSDNTTLMAESKEELKSLLIKMKEESEKAGLRTQHSNN